MSRVQELLTLALMLVGLFLVLNNWKGSTNVINSIGRTLSMNFKTLQGR